MTLIALTTQGGIPTEENKEANTSMTCCCISSFIQRLIYVPDLMFYLRSAVELRVLLMISAEL